MKKTTEQALAFLAKRNPFHDQDVTDSMFMIMLMEFMDTHGEDAVIALAGFYLYVIQHKTGHEQSRWIRSTFAHDIGGRKDKIMEPRSSSYGEFFLNDRIVCTA